MANSIVHFLLFGLFFSLFELDPGFALANSRFAFEGTTVFRCGVVTEGITVFRCSIATEEITVFRCSIATGGVTVFGCGVATGGLPSFGAASLPGGLPSFEARRFRVLQRALANNGFAFEGTNAFRCGIITGGVTIFRSRMLPFIARRGGDRLRSMLSTVCCDKFLTLWDLVNSVFKVSFWAKAFDP